MQKIIDLLGFNIHEWALRIMAYLMHKIMFTIYQDIKIHEHELAMVIEACKETPVVLLPNHRSYMDFLLLSTAFFMAGVPIPAIASGEDFLNIGPVTFMLRSCGAFFMRRSFKEDPL